jgi:hypothetical protein
VLLLAVQPPAGEVPSLGYTATMQQIIDQISESTAIVTGTVMTPDATPALLAGLPELPNQRCVCRLTGQITAQKTTNGDTACWDIAMILKRTGVGVTPVFVGSASAATVFAEDVSMAPCTVVPAVSSGGPNIIVTGIAATPIEWAFTLQIVTAD